MNSLTDTLTEEKHIWNPDFAFYDYVEREFMGRTLQIAVEIGIDWDGTPGPESRYYARVAHTQSIGDGIQIKEDSFIMLDEIEQDDVLYSKEVTDWKQECRDADDHEKDVEHYHAITR